MENRVLEVGRLWLESLDSLDIFLGERYRSNTCSAGYIKRSSASKTCDHPTTKSHVWYQRNKC